MKYSKIVLFFSLVLLLFESCAVEQTMDNSKPLSLLDDTEKIVKLSDIFAPVSCTSLDLHVCGKLKWIKKIECDNNKYYVLGGMEQAQVFVFDSKGNFLQNVGAVGHGPGEYVYASDFAIDVLNKRIVVLEAPSKVFVYDLDGKFLFSKKLKETAFWNLAINGKEYVFSTNHLGKSKNDNLLYVYDADFKLKEKLIDVLPFAVGVTGIISNPLQVDGEYVNYIDQASQCIYTYRCENSLAMKSYHWELPNPMPSEDYSRFMIFQQNQQKYDFILDALKIENRVLVSYKKDKYVYVKLMDTKGVSKVMGHMNVSVPTFYKSNVNYVFLAIRGREFLKNVDSYFPKYKKNVKGDESYLIFKCKLR